MDGEWIRFNTGKYVLICFKAGPNIDRKTFIIGKDGKIKAPQGAPDFVVNGCWGMPQL